MNKKTFGVILSGCGYLDGAEIRESVLTLLALDKAGIETIIMAPNMDQHHVINHLTGEEVSGEKRNTLVEAARIARGKVEDIKKVNPEKIDGLIIPGGFGVAKNLSSFAFDGAEASVHPDVKDFINKVYLYNTPIGAICIAPALMALLFGKDEVQVTIGNDTATAGEIEKTGAKHFKKGVTEIQVDEDRKVVSTPAYMFDSAPLNQIFDGIEKCIEKVIEMAE